MEKEKSVKKGKTGIYLIFIFAGLICGYVFGCLIDNNGMDSEAFSHPEDEIFSNYFLQYVGINPVDYSDIGFGDKLIEAYMSEGDHDKLLSFVNSYAYHNKLFEDEGYFDPDDPKCNRTVIGDDDSSSIGYCYLLSQSNFDMIIKMYALDVNFQNYSFENFAIFDDGRITIHTSTAGSKQNNNFNTYYEIYELPVNLDETGIFVEYKYDVVGWSYPRDGVILRVRRTKKTNLGEVLETQGIKYGFKKRNDGRYYISFISIQ